MSTVTKPVIGQPAPAFNLPDQNGTVHSLEQYRGKKVVLYFYPKDDTPGCTVEACSFRDSLPSFEGAVVFGVSPDTSAKHKKFEQKFNLNFTLLADIDHSLSESYGVWVEKSMYGKKYMGVERSTFLIDENGVLVKIWEKVKPETHVAEVQAALA